MIKSKWLQLLVLTLVIFLGWLSVHLSFPKYTGQYFALVILVLSDIYLWTAFKKSVFHYGYFWRTVFILLFWLPALLVVIAVFGSLVVPFIEWNDTFRTYIIGFILVFYTAKIFPLFFLLVADLLRLFQKLPVLAKREHRQELVKTDEGITRSKFLQYMAYLSGGLVMGTMLTGMFKWVYQFNVVREKIGFKRLPGNFDGFKVVQISDMHLGSWKSEKPLEEAVRIINGLDADLVLFTGDLVNFATKEAFRFEKVLKKIKARHGVYASLGNHDYGDYVSWPTMEAKKKNMQALFNLYRRLEWKLMNNRHELITRDGQSVALVGVENWGSHLRFPKRGDIKKAVKGIPDGTFKILMSHDPTHWDSVILPGNYDIDITLAGHTHGFQFGIETKKLKWSPAQWVYKHWAGLYSDKNSNRLLYVNRGLGSIGYPGRIGILPEITILELYPEA